MLTIGTRGEVQPLVALGLQVAGLQVCIAAHTAFQSFFRGRSSQRGYVDQSLSGCLDQLTRLSWHSEVPN